MLNALPLVAGLSSLLLVVIILFSSKDQKRYGFSVFALGMALWGILITAFLSTPQPETAEWVARSYYVSAAVLIYGFLLFTLQYSKKKRVVFWACMSAVPLVLISVLVVWPGVFIEVVGVGNERIVTLDPVPYLLFTVYFTLYLAIGFGILLHLVRRVKLDRYDLERVSLIFKISAICIPLGAWFNLYLPYIGDYSRIMIGPIFILPIVFVVFYAIKKHGLFDIKLAAVRSIAYLMSLSTLAGIYYVVAYFVSIAIFQSQVSAAFSLSPLNILLALGLAFIFQPIKGFFDRATDKIFFRDRYDTDDFYARLNEVLTSTTELRGLLQRVSHEIGSTLKSEQAFFFVQYADHHVSAGTKGHSLVPLTDTATLNEYVKKNGDSVIVGDLLDEHQPVRRLLESHRIALVMPLVRKNTVLGYLALGEHRGGVYTERDIKVLRTVSHELIIAIQNALSVQEIKDINTTLQQRIAAATKELTTSNAQLRHLDTTKDEFLSMASHQLRTPLTSVKGYISMVLEGDTGKITEAQRQLLTEAFASSERMVHLIHDFLNVSRLQTGKFTLERHPVDLDKLVAEEVRSLQRVAEPRGIKITYTQKGKIPIMTIDESKVQQVVMNYIDNAIYYSRAETKPIEVRLERVGEALELRVIDTGIGVPKSEQSKLFNRFFRASNARKQRPDGTGVGIYLAKKVVTAHGGDIIFSSQEGKGSTFGFRLPFDINTES